MTAAPARSASRSIRSRVLGRSRDHAKQERAVLVLHDVTKEYPNGRVALRDVDLVIPEGDFVFLVGPSGAGKSTLIRLLIRDEIATNGEVVFDGQDVARLTRRQVPKLRRKIGVVFQDFKLLPSKTVRENVAFALEVTGTPRRKIRAGRRPRPRPRRPHRPGGAGSGPAFGRRAAADGDRPRARPRRGCIIADEPTGNLDPLISWEILQLLLRINEIGVTVLMATHNAEFVTALRRRVVALEEGRVVRDEVGGAYHRAD